MTKKEFKDKLLLITYAVVLFVCLLNYRWIGSFIGFLGNIFFPFIIGIIIAFILNVIVNMLENTLLKKVKSMKRTLSIITSLVLVFGFVIVMLFILIPQVKNAGMIFVENIPEYQETIYSIGEKVGLSEHQLDFINLENNKLKDELTSLIANNSESIINMSMVFANSVLSALTNFFVGLIFAIYVLIDKENLMRQFKKLLRKILNEKIYNKVLEIAELSNNTFQNFVKVQAFEAFILGFLCFIGMLICRLPYAATISVLVGFTALIPIFGAFIGCIVGAFLIFMVNPLQALIFIIFFLVLQQIEGNLIYPHVVGGKIGLPSIWVLVAVMVGGSLGGIFGMLLGVPILSIIYTLIKTYVNPKKSKKIESSKATSKVVS